MFTNIISFAIVLRCKHSWFCLGLLTARSPSDGSHQRPPSILSASLIPPSVWHAGGAGCASEERLFHKLFSHYNQLIRPVENVSDPVRVHFEVAITQLANVVSASNSPPAPQRAPPLRSQSPQTSFYLLHVGNMGIKKIQTDSVLHGCWPFEAVPYWERLFPHRWMLHPFT